MMQHEQIGLMPVPELENDMIVPSLLN